MLSPFQKKATGILAALLCVLAAAFAVAQAHPANPTWRDWMGLTKVPAHDDCFLQQRLSLDRSNGLQVRSVKVCY